MMLRGILGKWRERRAFTQHSRMLFAPPPAAGVTVTSNNIDTLAAVERAISLVSSDVARLPWDVVTRQPDGSLVNQTGPTETLLKTWPSQSLHSYAWRRHIVRTAMIHGNCVCHIQRSGRGDILQLVPIDPDIIQLESDDNGDPVYVVNNSTRLSPAEVLHFRTPGGPTGLWGVGMLESGRESLPLLKVQGETNAAIHGQGVAPRCVIKHPGKLSEELATMTRDRFEAAFRRRNAGGTVLMMDGMSVEPLEIKMGASDLVEGLNYSIAEVSRLSGVPVSMLSEHSHSTFSNVQEMNRSYHDTCLVQWLTMIAAEIGAKILPTTREIRWDVRELTKGTMQDQVNAMNTAVSAGVMTRNEARRTLGLNPIEGGDVIVLMPGMTQEDDDEDADDGFDT